MNSRLGRFELSEKLVRDYPKETKIIMSHCLVLSCKFNYANKVFEYEACCDLFDELPIGQMLPDYQFSVDEKGKVRVAKND